MMRRKVQRLSIRSTTLNSFQDWLNDDMWVADDVDQSTVESFIQYMNRPISQKADFGTAFHDWLECETLAGRQIVMNHGDVVSGKCGSDTYSFKFIADEYKSSPLILPMMIATEVPISRSVQLDGVTVTLTGTVDAMSAGRLEDYKTTGTYSYTTYDESMQWRLYSWVTGIHDFVYHVWERKDPLGADPAHRLTTYHDQWCRFNSADEDRLMHVVRKWVSMCKNFSGEWASSNGIEKAWCIK